MLIAIRPASAVLLACIAMLASPAGAITFSLSAGSPSVTAPGGFSPADLLTPGPGGTPVVAFSAASLGLGPGDDIDAVSFGLFQGGEPYFSVGASSTGATGSAVRGESSAGQQAGDVYKDPFPVNLPGSNVLVANQDALGLVPALGPGVSTNVLLDDLDALDMDLPSLADPNGDGIPDLPIYFSLAAGSPTLLAIAAGPADILVAMPFSLPTIAVSAQAMGLTPNDDVDALLYDPGVGGTLLISLTASSISLSSGADVIAPLITPPGFLGPSLINQTISTLGLLTGDELDAFSDQPVPEPASAALLGLGLAALAARRRRARR